MTISLFQASVPVFLHGVASLSGILTKAASHAETRKIDPGVLLQTRLFPDMFALARQVQVASDFAKGAPARLAGVPSPSFADDETTFDALQGRLTKTSDFLNTLTPAQIDGGEDRDVTIKVRGRDVTFKGQRYLLSFALPNFFFHMTTAYAILRASGVELSKPDFVGHLPELAALAEA
jgi:uncharacterized protein